jgi:hypothetical protein
MHMKNVQIKSRMCHMRQFVGKVVLDSELETNLEIGQKHEK